MPCVAQFSHCCGPLLLNFVSPALPVFQPRLPVLTGSSPPTFRRKLLTDTPPLSSSTVTTNTHTDQQVLDRSQRTLFAESLLPSVPKTLPPSADCLHLLCFRSAHAASHTGVRVTSSCLTPPPRAREPACVGRGAFTHTGLEFLLAAIFVPKSPCAATRRHGRIPCQTEDLGQTWRTVLHCRAGPRGLQSKTEALRVHNKWDCLSVKALRDAVPLRPVRGLCTHSHAAPNNAHLLLHFTRSFFFSPPYSSSLTHLFPSSTSYLSRTSSSIFLHRQSVHKNSTSCCVSFHQLRLSLQTSQLKRLCLSILRWTLVLSIEFSSFKL